MNADLGRAWTELLPDQERLGARLLDRWSEPHRTYHDLGHLRDALRALAILGGVAPAERFAIWFHDVVHTGTPGPDELRSAEFARQSLSRAGLPADLVHEVARLVLVTVDHSPAVEDLAAARVSDADIAILGAEPARYLRSVAALRAESRLTDTGWRTARIAVLTQLLDSEQLYHTAVGSTLWEATARRNLSTELRELKHRLGNSATR